ncbi:MAG: hypothetical protein PHV06_08530 [bacterium]|nr:hypothetical protein [bacterium]
MKILKNILILFSMLITIISIQSCKPYKDYVDVNLRTLKTVERHEINTKIEMIQQAVMLFKDEKNRSPESIDELVKEGYLQVPPKDCFGNGFKYDPETNTVTSITFEAIEKQKKKSENNK